MRQIEAQKIHNGYTMSFWVQADFALSSGNSRSALTRQNTPNARNTRLVARFTPTAHGRAGDRQPRSLGTKSQS